MKNVFNFKTKVIIYGFDGKAGAWHFATVPENIADEINFFFADQKRGWGSLPVEVTIGESTWNTSIFPDKRTKSFMLPLKASVRKQEQIDAGDSIEVELKIRA